MNSSLIKAILIDDEKDARENIKTHLKAYAHVIHVIAEAENVDEGIELVNKYNPHLIFLDIAMPRKSGFELLSSLPDFKGQVIFVTSFNQYAEDAFKFLALGYIIKPIDEGEFHKTVDHAIEIIHLKNEDQNYPHLLQLLENKNSNNKKIVIPLENGYEVLKQEDIFFLEGQRNYTYVVCKNRRILVSKNLSKVEQWLSKDLFMRVHRSYVVNIQKITRVANDGFAILENEEKVDVSRPNRDILINRLAFL